jgi:putative ubiquitin-RnfH superfamily antitoxin RatB of RatAB toxin-antitoxin module
MRSYCARAKFIRRRPVSDAPLEIEIVYAEPQRAIVKELRLPGGACVADALRLAALDPDFIGVDLEHSALGIFGRLARRDQPLRQGDRIVIYRPLAADPKEARRARAKQARKNSA